MGQTKTQRLIKWARSDPRNERLFWSVMAARLARLKHDHLRRELEARGLSQRMISKICSIKPTDEVLMAVARAEDDQS